MNEKNSPRLAVLMPAHNAEDFIHECIDAVIGQSFTDFEFYICDDGSSDNTPYILQKYSDIDDRIKILRNEKNAGIAATRNRLLSVLPESAEFVAWIDADDVCFPQRFQMQIDFLNSHPEIGGVGSALDIIDEQSKSRGFRKYPTHPDVIRKKLPRVNVIAQPSIMLRRTLVDAVGQYSLSCPVAQDYEYWLRAIEKFEFANIAEPLLHYRISGKQVKQSKLKQSLSITLRIQREYFQRNNRSIPLSVLLYQFAGMVMMYMPAQWVMKLFCLLTYQKRGK